MDKSQIEEAKESLVLLMGLAFRFVAKNQKYGTDQEVQEAFDRVMAALNSINPA